jgi:branched-chain amino acid transport system ATP-binding protein/branched-chain amino acid transport system permease protein
MTTWYRYRERILRGLVAVGMVLLVAWPWLADAFTSNRGFYVSLVGATLISTMLVLSLNLVMGYSGLLSIIHTGLLAVGGYTSAVLTTRWGWSAWLGIPVAVVVATLFGVVVTLVSLRATYLYFGMITLSFNLLAVEIAREWESVTGGFFGLVGVPQPTVFGRMLTQNQFYLLIVLAAVAAYLYQRNIVLSRAGRAFQAIRESPDAASALGIRVNRTKVTSFALASALGGLAGALFAHWNTFINPDVGLLDNALVLFIGLMLGGISTLPGPVLGVGLFAIVDQVIKDLGQYRRLILGLALLFAMVVIPRGMVGQWRASRWGRELHDDASQGAGARDLGALQALEGARAGEPVVTARGVRKSFGGVHALQGVDISVRGGEVHGIIGPNGSGKSTLVNCLTAFLEHDDGEITLFGRPRPSQAHEVAEAGVVRVFQIPHLFERVSVLDNVLTGMHMRSKQNWFTGLFRLPSFRRDERTLRVEARGLLGLAGLAHRADWSAASLSHGQKRLLEVVRAVASRPSVLILDEPATGLTSVEVEDLHLLIRALQDAGLTIVLIEHNMAFVMRTCDRITVLDQGEVIAVGSPREVQASARVQEAYLGPTHLVKEPG